MRVFSLFLVVGVTVGGLKRSRGMRIVALTPSWSRNTWVIFSVSCVSVIVMWGSCTKKWSMQVACSG